MPETKYPDAYLYGRIQVADHCFLGAHCILLPGAKIGAGSVIGSGSIVTGEIPSGVVAIGVPAKPVKSVEEYIQEKRHLWIDTRGLTPDAKRELCFVAGWQMINKPTISGLSNILANTYPKGGPLNTQARTSVQRYPRQPLT